MYWHFQKMHLQISPLIDEYRKYNSLRRNLDESNAGKRTITKYTRVANLDTPITLLQNVKRVQEK